MSEISFPHPLGFDKFVDLMRYVSERNLCEYTLNFKLKLEIIQRDSVSAHVSISDDLGILRKRKKSEETDEDGEIYGSYCYEFEEGDRIAIRSISLLFHQDSEFKKQVKETIDDYFSKNPRKPQ